MKIVTRTSQVVLGIAFLGAGGQKLAGVDQMVEDFDRFEYPQWFRVVTGGIEVGGALGMLAGIFRPALIPFAGLLLAATMTGAIATHIRIKDPAQKAIPPTILLVVTPFVSVMLMTEMKSKAE